MKRIFTTPDSIRNFSGRRQFPRQQARQQKGSIMLLTVVTIMGMIGTLALAIDLGFLFSSRTQLQNGVNAATLAAGAGLRLAIEDDPGAPQQAELAKALAVRYGALNQLRRFSDPDPKSNDPNRNDIVIDPGNVIVDTATPNDIPTVRVRAIVPIPTIFAGIFGLDSVDLGARAKASLLPVDGGTGTIGTAGDRRGGCWRPLFLPDTFYDSANMVKIVGDNTLGSPRLPNQPGDYYRSRFAAGARDTFPFVDPVSISGFVTGLRDTQLRVEVGQQTIMGQGAGVGEDLVTFRRDYYFIANFSALPSVKINDRTVYDQASFGYCGEIRVGDEIPVFPINNPAKRDEARRGLLEMHEHTLNGDRIELTEETMFRYVKSAGFPVENSHGAIIPVLLYDPMLANNLNGVTRLRVTNIGLFFLKEVTVDGDLKGYFVREILAGGTPIESANLGSESANFKRRWLPMSVQLLN